MMFSAEVSYLDVLLGPQQALPGEARVLITAGVKGGRHHLGLSLQSQTPPSLGFQIRKNTKKGGQPFSSVSE